jgi:dynein heavy chain
LRDRLQRPRGYFDTIAHPIFSSKEAARIFAKYDEMLVLLAAFEVERYNEWAKDVGEKSNVNLSRNLLVRDEATRLISVNFDPQLVAVLREV